MSVGEMDSCWRDDTDLCDIRSDASLLRMQMDGIMRPVDMLVPGTLAPWVHWLHGAIISCTGIKCYLLKGYKVEKVSNLWKFGNVG